MTLLNAFKSFANDEAGAVTVDWVVLTAAIVGLGIVVMTSILQTRPTPSCPAIRLVTFLLNLI